MKGLIKLGLLAGAAYGGYYLYKKYLKQPDKAENFDDLSDAGFDYDDTLQIRSKQLQEDSWTALNKQIPEIQSEQS